MTYKREVFPGAGLPKVVGGYQTMSDQELLSRLHRAVNIYKDEAAMARDPMTKKAIGHHILTYVKELRDRGFVVTQYADSFVIHQRDTVELVKGKRVEIVGEFDMKRRVYWAVSDEMHNAEKRGDRLRRTELFRALCALYTEWKIKAVSRSERKLAFGDEPGVPFK